MSVRNYRLIKEVAGRRNTLVFERSVFALIMVYKNCPAVLQSYLRYSEMVQNRSAATVQNRYRDIRKFLVWLFLQKVSPDIPPGCSEPDISDLPTQLVAAVTEDDIEAYLEYLIHEKKTSQSTIYYSKLSSLRSFFDYLSRHQEELGIQLTHNPVPENWNRVPPEQPCRELSPSEISRVLKAIQGEAAVRDTAIVLLIATTGISMRELVKIRCQDYQEDILFVAGRKVRLTQNCQDALQQYLLEFRDPTSDVIHDNALFVSHNYLRRLTPRGVQKALQKHFDRAGVQATARDLRHTAVIALLKTARNECELAYIAGYLGYTSTQALRDLHLPKPTDNTTKNPVEDTWLSDLGN